MVDLAGSLAKPNGALGRILDDIDRLELEPNLLELETNGYTVVRGVLTADQIARARSAILSRVEKLTGRRLDPDTAQAQDFPGMQYLPYLLFEDDIFAEILMAERPLALMTYLLGESCQLSSMGCHFRGPGGAPLLLHCDNTNGAPTPYSPTAFVANINYALSPYTRENGALIMVPGSHRNCRQPTAGENFSVEGLPTVEALARAGAGALDDTPWRDPPGAVPMLIDPGDAVVFHGNTWHGGLRRDSQGLRINLAAFFCRQFVQTQELRGDPTCKAMMARHGNNARFQVLLGGKQPYGWQDEGPPYALFDTMPRGLHD
jgi:ectoine hydroxylase-related dioxygenase (phytanoyl-CoA dioxygenase family)